MFHTTDRDDDFIQLPRIVWPESIAAIAVSEVLTKAVGSQPDGLPADNDTPVGQQNLNIRRTQIEAVVHLDGVRDDLTRVAPPLQARH